MAPFNIVRVSIRAVELTLLLAIMLTTVLPMIDLTFFKGLPSSLVGGFIAGEIVGLVIIALIFLESIFAWRYDLQAYGYLVFQAIKLFLWTAGTLTGTGVMINMLFYYSGFAFLFVPMVAVLFLVLIVFLAGFLEALNCYYKDLDAAHDSETTPLLAEHNEA